MKKVQLFFVAAILSTMMYAQDKKMSEIKINQLPKGVADFVKQNLPGATITRAGKIEEKNEISYVAVVEVKGTKHSYVFDKDGKFKGKGDQLKNNNQNNASKTAPANTINNPKAAPAKPPVNTQDAKQDPKAPATDVSVPKK